MKRYIAWILSMLMVVSFFGCGSQEVSEVATESSEPVTAASTVETVLEGAYVIPSDWTEVSAIREDWGYVTSGVELENASYEMAEGYLTARCVEDDANVLLRLNLDGTEVNRITVPRPEMPEGDDWSVGHYCFTEECVWFVENYYTRIDEETGELSASYTMKKWSLSGEELLSFDMEKQYGITDDNFLCDLELDRDGNPLIQTLSSMIFCDDMGIVLATCETPDAATMEFVRDKDGRVYCYHFFENQLYTMDWENHALGEPVLELDGNVNICTGSGEYDLLLSGEMTLKGVSFANGTITEILSWSDLNMAGMVGGVSCLEGGVILASVHDLLLGTTQMLTLTPVPADQIPEKTVVTLAVGMSPGMAEWGATWTDCLDEMVATQMANFNRSSDTYQVEVVTYSSARELQLMLNSGDAPDIIDWNSTAWLDETPSLELYAKRGYLVDLQPMLEQEGLLSEFIPSIVDLVTERTDGIHAMPTSFYLTTLMAPREYVGTEPGWSYGEMLSVAKQLPEDMALWGYIGRREALQNLIWDNMDEFVDTKNADCDFTNQEFYDLLTICREYFPASLDENYTEPSGGSLLTATATMGRMGNFASDVLRNMEASGKTFIGYPGDDGNGFTAIYYDEFSICTLGDQQEGAWEFLKTLYGYDYQYSSGRMFSSVRSDVFHAREDWYLEVNGSCTREESMEARTIVDGVRSYRNYSAPAMNIVLEEAEAFFAGDKTAEAVAEIIENRVKIYLSEQS